MPLPFAGVVQWQNSSLPSWPRGSDSLRPLHFLFEMATVKTYKSARVPAMVAGLLKNAQSIMVNGHIRPDGDSLGSTIALVLALRKLGKKIYGVVSDKNQLGAPAFLHGVSELLTPRQAARKNFDLFVCLDCADKQRVPEEIFKIVEKRGGYDLCIDHHETNTNFAKVNWVRPTASSTGEIIWKMLKDEKIELDHDIAEALWVAVITDSGRFQYDLTSPQTLKCGADLLRFKINTAAINDRIYCATSEKALELKKRAYNSLKIIGDVAHVSLSDEDFRQTGGNKSDVEDAVNIPRSIIGNRIALFFYGPNEKNSESETKVSIRTRDGLNASELATLYGGGGHRSAAGCNISLPLNEAIEDFLEKIKFWRSGSRLSYKREKEKGKL